MRAMCMDPKIRRSIRQGPGTPFLGLLYFLCLLNLPYLLSYPSLHVE